MNVEESVVNVKDSGLDLCYYVDLQEELCLQLSPDTGAALQILH